LHIALFVFEMPADLLPSISVLLPVYNGELWLNRSIESVLSQTFADFELLIIDDGSTDSTLSIIKDFALSDSRVRYLIQQNHGLVYTLNRGIYASNAEWIARIDADDLWHPSKLSEQFSLIKDTSTISCVGTGFDVIDPRGSLIRSVEPPPGHHKILDQLLTHRTCFPHSSAMFRRDLALRLAGYRLPMSRAQDTDFWLRLSEVGCLAVVPRPLVSIRVHGLQLSSGFGAHEQLLFGWLAVVSYQLRLGGCPDPLEAISSISSNYQSFIHEGLSRAGFFKVRHMKLQLKKCLRDASFARVLVCVKLFFSDFLISPSLFLFLITEARRNRRLARQLAAKWSSQV